MLGCFPNTQNSIKNESTHQDQKKFTKNVYSRSERFSINSVYSGIFACICISMPRSKCPVQPLDFGLGGARRRHQEGGSDGDESQSRFACHFPKHLTASQLPFFRFNCRRPFWATLSANIVAAISRRKQ